MIETQTHLHDSAGTCATLRMSEKKGDTRYVWWNFFHVYTCCFPLLKRLDLILSTKLLHTAFTLDIRVVFHEQAWRMSLHISDSQLGRTKKCVSILLYFQLKPIFYLLCMLTSFIDPSALCMCLIIPTPTPPSTQQHLCALCVNRTFCVLLHLLAVTCELVFEFIAS